MQWILLCIWNRQIAKSCRRIILTNSRACLFAHSFACNFRALWLYLASEQGLVALKNEILFSFIKKLPAWEIILNIQLQNRIFPNIKKKIIVIWCIRKYDHRKIAGWCFVLSYDSVCEPHSNTQHIWRKNEFNRILTKDDSWYCIWWDNFHIHSIQSPEQKYLRQELQQQW